MSRLSRFALLAAVAFASPAFPDNAAAPVADPVVERPTLRCIGAYWIIKGDDNKNAAVNVEYRKQGESQWRPGPPLFRVARGAHKPREFPDAGVKVPADAWLFAGSVIGVEPDATYELKLTLADPDGGSATKTLATSTIAEPVAPTGGRKLHVIPGNGGGTGSQADPLKGIAAADKAAKPGDTILLRPGVYSGTVQLRKSGEQGKPIIWRGANNGQAILDGNGDNIIQAIGLSDLWFENLVFRNGKYALVTHETGRVVLRRNTFTDIEYGLTATKNSKDTLNDYFIADNVMQGNSKWPRAEGIEDRRGIQLSGAGHVVCYNRIAGFGDAIDTFQGPRNDAIDFHNNDVSELTDDGIETDYSQRNVRVFDNRLTNVYQGISTQPVYGGPVYIVRNVMYNVVVEPFKMHNAPSGAIIMHNTSVKLDEPMVLHTSKKVSNSVLRNNLFVGTSGRYAFGCEAQMEDCDFDYDGFAGGPFGNFLKWNGKRYKDIEDVRKNAPVYDHAVHTTDTNLFASGIKPPESADTQFEAGKQDLRLKPGTPVIDAGEKLIGINDGFTGSAPDLGAYELGSTPPHYGPRQ